MQWINLFWEDKGDGITCSNVVNADVYFILFVSDGGQGRFELTRLFQAPELT